MNIQKILGNRLLIEPHPELAVSTGGIALPQAAVKKQSFGTVRMLGTGDSNPKARALLDEFQLGQVVRVDHSFGSLEVSHNGKLHRIHSISDVQCIVG